MSRGSALALFSSGRHWRDALATVARVALTTASRDDLNEITLSVGSGCVRLYARSWAHAVVTDVRSETCGRGTVAMMRRGVKLSEWAKPGLLSIASDRVEFAPTGGELLSAPARPVSFPDLPALEAPACGGVLLDRCSLLRALPAKGEVPVHFNGSALMVGTALPPLAYATGTAFYVLLDARFLRDVLASADGAEASIESLGPGEPVRVAAGSVRALIAPRTPEPMI